MAGADLALWLLQRATHELALFAAVGILVGGVDDLIVDLFWLFDLARDRLVRGRAGLAPVPDSPAPPMAVFVPAWQEAPVIAAMLSTMLARWDGADIAVYVGVYPNDGATRAALVGLTDPRLRIVVNPRRGPTTKADNLNAMWRALQADDPGGRIAAVILHDAEDVVHSGELRAFAAHIATHDLVQLPVLPLIVLDRGRWAHAVSATYADEFAEAHGKQLVVRERIGAALPSAGVGCALGRAMLEQLAASHGAPFDAASVTEDYELGLRIAELGGRGTFARFAAGPQGRLVAVRAHFPDSLSAAVRQKARWQAGIALAGWERLGWSGGLAERWMRLRDRRAMVAALILFAGYLSGLGWAILWLLGAVPAGGGAIDAMFAAGAALLAWRATVRALVIGRIYGWREGLGSVPRLLLANLIAIAAARVALQRFLREALGAPVFWDKTMHVFPESQPAE